MTNFVIIRAHGCTVKDKKEIINCKFKKDILVIVN